MRTHSARDHAITQRAVPEGGVARQGIGVEFKRPASLPARRSSPDAGPRDTYGWKSQAEIRRYAWEAGDVIYVARHELVKQYVTVRDERSD